jgi:hypothetical protein
MVTLLRSRRFAFGIFLVAASMFSTVQSSGTLPRQADHRLVDSGGVERRGRYVSGGTRPSASWGRRSL